MENSEIVEKFSEEMQDLLKRYNASIFSEFSEGVVVCIEGDNYLAYLQKDKVKLEKC